MLRLRRTVPTFALAATMLAVAVASIETEEARACGGFFVGTGAKHRPSLAHEYALIIHDSERDRQHFVREVAFRKVDRHFGFVVPTPTRAEVAKVEPGLFDELRAQFLFDPAFEVGGSGLGAPARGVTVLEETKVGSFTAFVLAADDADALAQWLRDHELVTTLESAAWLEHYVRLHFFFVAMRYDPPSSTGGADGEVIAETIRISFDTPVPYYPYLEPTMLQREDEVARSLDLWVIAREQTTPVAVREQGGTHTWIRPLREGLLRTGMRDRLLELHGGRLAPLLPDGELLLQRYRDRKASREGIGDVLFVPLEPVELDAATRAALQPLLAILDPSLMPAEGER